MARKLRQFQINFTAASIGNLFEHYDKALFAFLAPFIAPLFFQNVSPIYALILTYAIMPLGLISRPIGAFIFGRIGDKKGRKTALYLTLIGMSLTTLLIGFIPTYSQVGWVAPALLALGRLTQNFFASGETVGGKLLIIEACQENKRGLFNSFYECSTIIGILGASFGVMLLSAQGSIETAWRLLYWIGGLTGFMGLFIRLHAIEPDAPKKPPTPLIPLLRRYRFAFTAIVLTSGFSYANYYMITTFLNGYLPLISTITKQKAMEANTLILGFDLLILPLAGFLTTRFSIPKLLLFFGGLIVVLSLPLYFLLASASFLGVLAIRLIFVTMGVGFDIALAPFYQSLIPKENRYTLMAFGSAIGAQLLGTSACSLSFWLYDQTSWAASPGLYLFGLGVFSIVAVRLAMVKAPQPQTSV